VPTDLQTPDLAHMVNCPGCGGRNPPEASECDWCGRQFVSPGRRLRITLWQVLSTLLILAVVVGVGILFLLNAGRTLTAPRLAAAPTPQAAASAIPTPAVTPRVTSPPTGTAAAAPVAQTPAPPTPTAEAAAAATEPPSPTATPEPETAHIANTGGQGVMVRAEPGAQAPAVGALRDGTAVVPTGQEQTVAAHTWREVETEDKRIKGWVSADFLQP
jgi:Bacterial SH3 domain